MAIKAFAYLRVSGKGQVDGDGFDRQLAACQAYAAVQSLDIVEVFREEGVSGTKELDDRPALSELFAALEENGIKTVIVERLDRLARDLMIQESLIADMQKHGYTLLSTAEPDLCSQDPTRVLMRQIFGAIAQYDKAMIVLKLRGARQRRKARDGKCEGQKAFGERPEEIPILEEILSMDKANMTHREIAGELNSLGLPTRSGGRWHPGTIGKILARQKSAA